MPKVQITEELATTIKRIRTDNSIKANAVANHIQKSPAYITKLEKGELKTIDSDTLFDILTFVSKEQGQSDFDLLDNIYSKLRVFYTPKELEQQVWFDNFESVWCKLPVPEDLIDEINKSIDDLGIDRNYLLSRINANEAISADVIKKCDSTPNQWKIIEASSEGRLTAIKIDLSDALFNRLLDKKEDTSSYIFIFCIVFYINKIRKFDKKVDISDSDYENLYRDTTEYLNKHYFFTVSKKNALISGAKDRKEAEQYLSIYDSENERILRDIINGLTFMSDVNIKKTNAQLDVFLKNMKWDLGFMMALISLDFSSLINTSHGNRKEILDRFKETIEEYKSLPKERRIEEY